MGINGKRKMLKQIYYDIKELKSLRATKAKKREKKSRKENEKEGKIFSLHLSFHSSKKAKRGLIAKDDAKRNSTKMGIKISLREALFMFFGFISAISPVYDPKNPK
jgi:hypothetical protein